jgi:hypothetical protein
MRRLVDDSFTCDASRKTAAFGNVLPYLHDLDPANTIIAGNLECASALTLPYCHDSQRAYANVAASGIDNMCKPTVPAQPGPCQHLHNGSAVNLECANAHKTAPVVLTYV